MLIVRPLLLPQLCRSLPQKIARWLHFSVILALLTYLNFINYMSEVAAQTTNINLGKLAASLAIGSVIIGGIFWLATIANNSQAAVLATQEFKTDLKDYPTRREFDTLQNDVSDIKQGVNKINQYLIEKKP